MSIGYLTGAEINELKNMGAISCLYSTSTTPGWSGALTIIYFFDAAGDEIAHQTGITEGFNVYRRKWGDCVKKAYKVSGRFKFLLGVELTDSTIYEIV